MSLLCGRGLQPAVCRLKPAPTQKPSVLSHHSFFGREDLQTGRPPAGENRLYEFLRQFLIAHLGGETMMIVCDRNEFDADVSGANIDDRVPDIRLPVICGTSDHSRVDDVPAAGEPAMPVKTGVRADD